MFLFGVGYGYLQLPDIFFPIFRGKIFFYLKSTYLCALN
jgi:hypothetical protein